MVHMVTSLVVRWVRTHLPVQGAQVQSLSWEDALEKGTVFCFVQSTGRKESDTTEQLSPLRDSVFSSVKRVW